VRPEAQLHVVAEQRPGGHDEAALEVGERQVGVDGQTLDLVEHRQVRRVHRVRAVHPAGDRDVQRGLLGVHRPQLHRRGVGAQQQPRLLEDVPVGLRAGRTHVDRVHERAGRVVGRVLRASKLNQSVSTSRPSTTR
jgi:hypothetical protein